MAHYLELLQGAGMIAGLQRYSGTRVRQRGSIPKLLALNTALMSATSALSFVQARSTPELWGRLVETAVGAHFASSSAELFYWRERNREVDFVLGWGKQLIAVEVKSGARKQALPGIDEFARRYRTKRKLLVGGQGIPVAEMLSADPRTWL